MARPLRIEFEGAWYHVMNKGAGGQAVFQNDTDRQYFLNLLRDGGSRYHVEVHAYCLMGNHYHLMLRTPEGNLGRFMRHLNGLYTQFHNRRIHRDGPLFRGRYKAILVEADPYWTHLSRYVHRNPLEAGMVRRLSAYRWSSYPAYIGGATVPAWLTTGYILERVRGPTGYRKFVEGETTNSEVSTFYAATRYAPVLASDQFKRRIAQDMKPHRDIPETHHLAPRPSIARILESVSAYFAVSEASLLAPTRGRGTHGPGRGLAMYLCQELAGISLREIADTFGLSGYASAGATVYTVRKHLETQSRLRNDLNFILQDLTP